MKNGVPAGLLEEETFNVKREQELARGRGGWNGCANAQVCEHGMNMAT